MITKLSLTQFRNFLSREFFFHENINLIIGDNGKGKTNLLEALCLLHGTQFSSHNFDSHCNEDSSYFSISLEEKDIGEKTVFHDSELGKKTYSINNTKTSKKKLLENSPKTVIFSPLMMNMMYLSPSLRRDFMDQILISSSPEYNEAFKKYKKVLLSRNKILKNISAGLSKSSELEFWNSAFVVTASIIYSHREELITYIQENTDLLHSHLKDKISGLELDYKSQVLLTGEYTSQLRSLLSENQEKDIIMRSSSFGPHRDDFCITTPEGKDITDFASRGEIKTLILMLKKLEISFIESKCSLQPILLIDDLLSELDEKNQLIFLKSIIDYQVFITCITKSPSLPSNIHTITLS